MSRIVEVIPHQTEWKILFEEEATLLREILGPNCITIHHIGSTSVEGLAAKPILDIMPVVKDILAVDGQTSEFEALGYKAKGEIGMAFRRVFSKTILLNESTSQNTHHLHVYEFGNPEIERHLLFRDYLRAHPETQAAYAALKAELAQKFPEDHRSYTLGKEAFIWSIQEEIVKETGFEGMRMVKALVPREWAAYHRIRKIEIFDRVGVVYDPEHPSIKADHYFHFVFIKGVEIIGAAAVEFWEEDSGVLRAIAIERGRQNQGLGAHFLRLIERWIRHQGKRRIRFHANPRAVPFYERSGYTRMVFNDYLSPLDPGAVDMGKDLT